MIVGIKVIRRGKSKKKKDIWTKKKECIYDKERLINIRDEIKQNLEKNYFLGINIWENRRIDLDKYIKQDHRDNILFDISIKEEESWEEKEAIGQVREVIYRAFPKPLIKSGKPAYKSTIKERIAGRPNRKNKEGLEIGINYEIFIWLSIEKLILEKRDISLLDKEMIWRYKNSFYIFIEEVNKVRYINYYTHIDIIRESNYRELNSNRDKYIYERIKRIIFDLIGIEVFKDDGVGYLGVLFSIQIDRACDLIIYKDKNIKISYLDFYEKLFPDPYRKTFRRNKLMDNIYNPGLEECILDTIKTEKEFLDKEDNKSDIDISSVKDDIYDDVLDNILTIS